MNPKQKFNEYFKLNFPSVNSFREARALYEATKPLHGKRAMLNVRPIGSNRRHGRFQINKISDTEYAVVGTYINSLRTLKFQSDHQLSNDQLDDALRLVSFHKNGQMHIHTPIGMRCLWNRSGKSVIGRQHATNQIWNFLSQVLPDGMYVETLGKWKGSRKTYLVIESADGPRYYLLPQTDYTLRLRRYAGQWQVINPVQELTPHLKPEVIGFTRRAYKDFWRYADNYWDLVPNTQIPAGLPYKGLTTWVALLRAMIKDPWAALLRMNRMSHQDWTKEQSLEYWRRQLRREFYRSLAADAFDFMPVPIGKKCQHPRFSPDLADNYDYGATSLSELEIPF